MKKKLLKQLLYVCVFYSILTIHSQTNTNLNPIKDNTIYSESSNSNGLGELFSGVTQNNDKRRALIKFNLSSIPNGATINSVTLTLNTDKVAPGTGNQIYRIHKLNKDWGEGTSSGSGQGATAVAPDTNWTNAILGSSTWTNPGGDFDVSSLASINIGGNGNYTFLSTTNLVNLVQNWLDTPLNNFGVILIGDETTTKNARRFGSKDIGVAPILSINWTSTLSIDDFNLKNLVVSPNPSKNFIELNLPNSLNQLEVIVYDVLGKKILNTIYTANSKIDISNFKTGVYLIKATAQENTIIKRFIKF